MTSISASLHVLRTLSLSALVGLVLASSVAAQAKTPEPTLSIPKASGKSTCVGWAGCTGSISEALKNAKTGATVYVKAGSGVADNLKITKAVTLCAAVERGKCLAAPSEHQRFRLIRREDSKPCIEIALSRSGNVSLKGMEIRDNDDPGQLCLVKKGTRAAASRISVSYSHLENVGLKLSNLKSVTVEHSNISNTYNQDEQSDWVISDVVTTTIRTGVTFYQIDLTIDNSESALSLDSFTRGELSISGRGPSVLTIGSFKSGGLLIGGTGSSRLTNSRFENSGLTINGTAIRQIEHNWFEDSWVALDHDGMTTFTDNVLDSAPFREPFGGEASLLIGNGVNRVIDNNFGSECSGYPSDGDSTCSCTRMPAIEILPAADGSQTAQIQKNGICTDEPQWLKGNIGLDVSVRGNCKVTYKRDVYSVSRKIYRTSKTPPASELIVRLLHLGDGWSCQ